MTTSSIFSNISTAVAGRKNIIFLFLSSLLSILSLSACFTGIEGTKKISLSREDKKALAPTPEEIFFPGIEGEPLQQWSEGKQFLAADDKAILVFERRSLPQGVEDAPLGGKKLSFNGILSKMDVSGTLVTQISFTDGLRYYVYNTGKPLDQAMTYIKSDQIPMLIDLNLVKKVKDKLVDHKLWTRSPLWYDDSEERIDGKRFVPVTIVDVVPGNMIFPLKIQIEEESGNKAWMFMNYGNSGTESRSFHNLFSLDNPKRHYPNVSDEVWKNICEGKIILGMTKEECKLALGNPTSVNAGHDYSQTLDIWTYDNGAVLWFVDGILSRFRN